MSAPGSVLVVGASASGLSTVEALRRKGYGGAVTVLGAESHPPYDRPPLSKQVLSGTWEPSKTVLRPQSALSELDADFVLGDPAAGLDLAERAVRTESGRRLRADAVVVATGMRARNLPAQRDLRGLHVLRTLEDSLALRADLLTARRAVVVGDGVLGAEITATARGMGLPVTMVGPQPAPMAAQLGPLVADRLADLHTENGADLRLGTGVDGFAEQDGRVTGVRLQTGEVLAADVVVVAVGAAPVTDWLAGSGVQVDDGVVCDSRCRAAEGVYAVGDVARWWHQRIGGYVRFENRTNATAQSLAVAGNVLGNDEAYAPVPYFWTDQYDVKVQMHGFLPSDAEVTVVDGELAEGRFVAQYERDGQVTGVLGWNMAKQARIRRRDVVESLAAPTAQS